MERYERAPLTDENRPVERCPMSLMKTVQDAGLGLEPNSQGFSARFPNKRAFKPSRSNRPLKRIELALHMTVIALVIAHLMISPAKADDLTDAVNVERARHGLHALSHEPNLAAWASLNNGEQAYRGLGHHVLRGFGQVALWCGGSPVTPSAAVAVWMSSAAHRHEILRPEVRFGGGVESENGQYWTFNTSYAPFQAPKTIESKPAERTPGQLRSSAGFESTAGSAPSGSAPAPATGTTELMTPLCGAGCSTGPGYSNCAPAFQRGNPGRRGFRRMRWSFGGSINFQIGN